MEGIINAHSSRDMLLVGAHVDPRSWARRGLGSTGLALCAILIVSFQLGLLPLFQPLFVDDEAIWPLFHYGFWTLTLAVTGATLVVNPDVFRRSMPVLAFCALCLGLTALHPFDHVAKNYIVAVVLTASVVVLARASGPVSLLRFSATVTALGAVYCLLDLLFADGLSNTAGRAAGLGVNPNVSAASLLLGATASWWVVQQRWKLSFLILVGAAIFGTLSRSVLLVAALIVALSFLASFWRGRRVAARMRLAVEEGWRRALLVAFAVLACLSVALWSNERFKVAVVDSYAGLAGSIVAFRAATETVTSMLTKLPPARSGHAAPTDKDIAQRVEAEIEALGKIAEEMGQSNSASARALLFQRSLLAYRTGPFFGQGLATAHDLSPHNTYLMFAVAFGHLGWLVPLGLVALTLRGAWTTGRFQLGVAVGGVMMLSHDVMLFPGMLIPIALGIAMVGFERRPEQSNDRHRAPVALVTGAATVLLAAGLLAVHSRSQDERAVRFDEQFFLHNRGYSYIASIPRPEFAGLVRIADVGASRENEEGARLVLSENGTVLSDRPVDMNTVSRSGRGLYSMWRRQTLIFSSSDNSDPRSNGRSYSAAVPLAVHPLVFLLFGATLIWCAVLTRHWGRRGLARG